MQLNLLKRLTPLIPLLLVFPFLFVTQVQAVPTLTGISARNLDKPLAPIVTLTTTSPWAQLGPFNYEFTFTFAPGVGLMNNAVAPVVTLGNIAPYTAHTVSGTAINWTTPTTWVSQYNLGGVTPEGLYHFRVSAAQDGDGVPMPPDITFGFVLDTTPPNPPEEL
ncbi:TPA: hypothetical protein DCX15_01620, partial [bacterium]|nr:hypothetical protein [bacterium]